MEKILIYIAVTHTLHLLIMVVQMVRLERQRNKLYISLSQQTEQK